jgi:hypothetical protein
MDQSGIIAVLIQQGAQMQYQFIASRSINGRHYKLFRIGEYQYEICELREGGFERVRLLVGYDCEQAQIELDKLS